MNQNRFAPLYLPGGLLLFVLLAGGVAVFYADKMVGEAEAVLRAKTQALSAARQKHANAGLEKDILLRFRETYSALEKVGFVGAEQRINWVDNLRVANRESLLFGVEYQIGQQEPFSGGADLGVGDLPMKQSTMKVKLPLLHEGDLMPFFRTLAGQKSGVFMMNSCELWRVSTGSGLQAQPNLSAECELSWVTVTERAEDGGKE